MEEIIKKYGFKQSTVKDRIFVKETDDMSHMWVIALRDEGLPFKFSMPVITRVGFDVYIDNEEDFKKFLGYLNVR